MLEAYYASHEERRFGNCVYRYRGICPGDAVFVHSSLSSIGYVQEGVATAVDALLTVLGKGLLAAPVFTFNEAMLIDVKSP